MFKLDALLVVVGLGEIFIGIKMVGLAGSEVHSLAYIVAGALMIIAARSR